MSYNGWKNWQTWNVNLWLSNDEGMYMTCRAAKHRQEPGGRFNAKTAKVYILMLMPNGTPDMKNKGAEGYKGVDWKAVAQSMNDF
jgi:hypothetical protein